MNKNIGEMKGRRFGRLLVCQFAGLTVHRKRLWKCLCDCGAFVVVVGSSLRRGATVSCGCYQKTAHRTHGQSRTRGGAGSYEYRVWAGILSRCTDSTASGHHNYGGRGIKVCDRWRSFENFFADMGPRPSSKHSIDRIDNDGDYEPKNCRWATKKEQDRNRRTNRLIAYNGVVKCVTEWAEEVGIHPVSLTWRLENGWTIKDALTIRAGGTR